MLAIEASLPFVRKQAAFHLTMPNAGPISALRGAHTGARCMKSWSILAFVGSLIFLVLFIKDWETKMGADRLSRMKLPHHSALDADPNLKLVSESSPYMRTER
jgi:hypothetical protein